MNRYTRANDPLTARARNTLRYLFEKEIEGYSWEPDNESDWWIISSIGFFPTDDMLKRLTKELLLRCTPNCGRVTAAEIIDYAASRGIEIIDTRNPGRPNHRSRFQEALNEMFDHDFTVKVIMDAYDKTRGQ
jgi:hypothetical protein